MSKFNEMQEIRPEVLLSVSFGVGKDYRLYSIKALYASLGERSSKALGMFHAFKGCGKTSTFFRKGKKLHGMHGKATL